MPQADVTARSLCLRWVPGSDGASPIRYFTVQLRELPGGRWQTYSSSVSHEATACVVERYGEGGEGPARRAPHRLPPAQQGDPHCEPASAPWPALPRWDPAVPRPTPASSCLSF